MDNVIYTDAMKAKGAADAQDFQERSAEMDGTAMYAEEEKIPDFAEAVKVKNMLERPAGQTNGFVCKNSLEQVVRLIQNYDSNIFTQEPGDKALAAHWRFVYSKDPKKAKPFLEDSTILAINYYSKDECCIDAGFVWRSKLTPNTWRPTEYEAGWDKLGTVEEIIGG